MGSMKDGHMATPPKQDAEPTKEQTGDKDQVSTRGLERLANVANQAAQAKRWQARKNGMASQEPPSEVRNLNHDAEARAQAEAAMQQMMAKPGGKRRGF
jgi:hypothetical protein